MMCSLKVAVKARCVDSVPHTGFLRRVVDFAKESTRATPGVYSDIHDQGASGFDAGEANNTAQKGGL